MNPQPNHGQHQSRDTSKRSLSLVLPAFNESESIAEAIDDATGALANLCDPYEVIVVDDGSSDRTAEIANEIAKTNPSASAVACGFGILAKGPIAVVLLCPPVFVYSFLTNGAVRLRLRHWFAMGAIATSVTLPWFIAGAWQDSHFLYEFFYKHNVSRFAGAYHARPFWFFIPVALIGGHP